MAYEGDFLFLCTVTFWHKVVVVLTMNHLLHSRISKINKIKKSHNNRMCFFWISGVVRHSNTRLKHISSFSTTLMSAAYRSTLSSQYHSAEIIYFLPIWRFIQKNLWSFEWFLCNVNKCCHYSQSCQLNNVWKWLMKKLVKTSHLEGTLLSR